jgi:hypothetical protein
MSEKFPKRTQSARDLAEGSTRAVSAAAYRSRPLKTSVLTGERSGEEQAPFPCETAIPGAQRPGIAPSLAPLGEHESSSTPQGKVQRAQQVRGGRTRIKRSQ